VLEPGITRTTAGPVADRVHRAPVAACLRNLHIAKRTESPTLSDTIRDDALSEAVKRLFRKIEKRTFANGNHSLVATAELSEPKSMKPMSLLATIFALGCGMGYAAAADIPKCSDPFVIQLMQRVYVLEMQQVLSDAQDGRLPPLMLLSFRRPTQGKDDFSEYLAAVRRGNIPLPAFIVTDEAGRTTMGVRQCKAAMASDPGVNGLVVATDVSFTVDLGADGTIYVTDTGAPSAAGGALGAAAKRQLGH
jgi:hypothetical protein